MKFICIFFIGCFNCCLNNDKFIAEPVTLLIAGQSYVTVIGDSLTLSDNQSIAFEYNSISDSLVKLKDPVGQNHLNFQAAKTGRFIPCLASIF